MGVPFHSIDAVEGFNEFAYVDRAMIGLNLNVAYAAAGGVNTPVTASVTIPTSAGLPANYAVFYEAGADVIVWFTAKSATGFTVNVGPRLSTDTVAAGTVNLLIVA